MQAHVGAWRMIRRLAAAVLAIVGICSPARTSAAGETYRVDPANSRVTIAVGKGGALGFVAGHTHEVVGPIGNGTVDVDRDDPARAQIHIVIATGDLTVSGKGEPPADVPKVQETMRSDKVLDVARYPEISFQSTGVTVKDKRAATLELMVTGQLTIRDVMHAVTVPVSAQIEADAVHARGRFSIKQTDYGIKPVSVAGVVNVKDALDISFSIVASRK